MSEVRSVAAVEGLDARPRADERATPSWAGVFSLALGVFGLVTAEFLPASLLTPIATDLGVSNGAAGQTVTATAVIGAVAGLATPIVTGRLDRRIVMWSLTLLLVLSSLLAATAHDLPTLLVARLLLGIGLGGFWSMAGAVALRLVPARLIARAMSLIFTGVSVATVSAAPVGAYLGGLLGWRAVFAIAAVIGAVTLLVQMLTLPRLPSKTTPSIGSMFGLLRRPAIRMVLLTILLGISGHFAGFTYVRPFLEHVPVLSIEMISLVLFAYGVGGFFGNFVGAAVIERSIAASVVAGSLMIAVMALVLVLFGSSVAVAAVAVAIWGFAFGALPVSIQTWAVRAAPDQAEGAGGLLVAAFQVAIASGAVLGGLFVDHLGAAGAIAYCGVATLAAATLVFAASRRGIVA